MGDVRTVDDNELAAMLDFYREVVIRKLDGLTREQATSAQMPSGTTMLGLVTHLTGVEHRWFEHRVDGSFGP